MAIPTFVWVAAITLQGIGMGLNAYSTSKAANRKREKTEQEPILDGIARSLALSRLLNLLSFALC